jgi:hypothetical protein
MKEIDIVRRQPALTVTPQALAADGKQLWLSSRDLGTFYRTDAEAREVLEELDPPGVVWAAVATTDGVRLTIGKGLNDDRYVYRYASGKGFSKLFPCPELTGSYLSFDGAHLCLSQWYKGLILKVAGDGQILDELAVGQEVCGHTFADGELYALRGTEKNGESWRIARLTRNGSKPKVEDLATMPFAARSLTFDGNKFWSNHRAGNETISFTLS